MLTQLLITTLALTALALAWIGVQRWTYVAEPGASGDWLEGRWGCSDCDEQDACVLKDLAAGRSSCTVDQQGSPAVR